MTLLRSTWVDDDGSGATGTVLDNAALQVIFDKLSLSMNSIVGGRLTLTSGTPVTTADVTGAATIYYTPYAGNTIALYDGVSAWNVLSFSETSLALGTLGADLPYDIFGYNNSGTLALVAIGWTNGTTRATALTTQDGVLVQSGSTIRRYLGTFNTTSTTTTEDSFTNRLLWNYYNRVRRPLRRLESTDTWPYSTAAYRQANNSASNRVNVVVGWAEALLSLQVQALAQNGTAGVAVSVNIGEDSSTTAMSGAVGLGTQLAVVNMITPLSASLHGHYPAVGKHFYCWLEYSQATPTTTWGGDEGDGTRFQSGISGSIDG